MMSCVSVVVSPKTGCCLSVAAVVIDAAPVVPAAPEILLDCCCSACFIRASCAGEDALVLLLSMDNASFCSRRSSGTCSSSLPDVELSVEVPLDVEVDDDEVEVLDASR